MISWENLQTEVGESSGVLYRQQADRGLGVLEGVILSKGYICIFNMI